jgi:hypothetical protein
MHVVCTGADRFPGVLPLFAPVAPAVGEQL